MVNGSSIISDAFIKQIFDAIETIRSTKKCPDFISPILLAIMQYIWMKKLFKKPLKCYLT